MKIGGYNPLSLIDYPGKIACLVFTSGCNFACPYCHNPNLARGYSVELISTKTVLRHIGKNSRFLDGVVISGGEPTLQPDLLDFCCEIKKMGLAVKLDTNGSSPEVVDSLICHEAVDYIAMDIKTTWNKYHIVAHPSLRQPVMLSVGIIQGSGLPHEFRTTCVKQILTAADIETMAYGFRGANLYILQQFKEAKVLAPEEFVDGTNLFSDKEMQGFKKIFAKYVKKCVLR